MLATLGPFSGHVMVKEMDRKVVKLKLNLQATVAVNKLHIRNQMKLWKL
jgi:hypothetical protein